MRAFSSIRKELKALSTGGKGELLTVIAVGWGLLTGMRAAYPILLPYLRDSFSFSLTAGGFLISILWLGSAVGQLPGGILADRYNERLVMFTSTIFVAAGLLVVITAPTLLILFAATGLVGVGQSLYPIARITSLSTIYPNRTGSALGVTMATGDLGQTLLPPIAGVLAGAFTWQAGFGFLTPLFLLSGISIWITLPGLEKKPVQNTVASNKRRLIFHELQQPNIIFMFVILVLYIFTRLGNSFLRSLTDQRAVGNGIE